MSGRLASLLNGLTGLLICLLLYQVNVGRIKQTVGVLVGTVCLHEFESLFFVLVVILVIEETL